MKMPRRSSVIVFLSALGVGFGGAAVARRAIRPRMIAPRDSGIVQSKRDSAVVDSAAAHAAGAPRADTARAAATDSTPPVVAETARIVPSDTLVRSRRERLAKVFAGMEPKDAAHVLEQMNDDDVVAVLAALRERQATAILAQLQPKRAATVTRTLLVGAVGPGHS